MNSDKIIDSIFSYPSLAIHVVITICWFAFGLDLSLFTNLLSVEAILLAILIGVNQKRHADDTKDHITKVMKKNGNG
jgi:hypothetical protein